MEKVNNYEWLDFSLPSGWTELGRKMIEECEAVYSDFEIIDLKEKFGAICCYCGGVPEEFADKVFSIIKKYEVMSAHTCCKCGRPAVKFSTGWILPWCDECGTDEEKYYKRFEDGQD